jgi:hypothetical protein
MFLKRKIEKILPETFFQSRKVTFRVKMLVNHYQRAMRCYYEGEAIIEDLRIENDLLIEENSRLKDENARALAMLS